MNDPLIALLRRTMAALHAPHEAGLRLMTDGCELDARHHATTYSAMVSCSVDGMQQLSGWLAEDQLRLEA